jgi:hypothetical protein
VRVLLLQLDGKIPNVALMRIAAHHRALGDEVELRKPGKGPGRVDRSLVERGLFDNHDRVYASLIFKSTRPLAERLLRVEPRALVGGTGWDLETNLESLGIGIEQDYSVYPDFKKSVGFSQRGCRLSCEFCVVPVKEGKVREVATIRDIWRGDPYPRHILLLDNDFFGQRRWAELIDEMKAGDYLVSFNQGINARMLNRDTARAIASVKYRDDSMKVPRIYTAWDNLDDERTLFRGLTALAEAGVKPDAIMVYMLVGYWAGENHESRERRRVALRAFGARPYPMPYVRTPELTCYQRWIAGAFDKTIPWDEWVKAKCEPRKLTRNRTAQLHLRVVQ